MLVRKGAMKGPRKVYHEPGLRLTRAVLGEDSHVLEEIQSEEHLESDLDVVNVVRTHDMEELERRRQKDKLGFIITAKKFFKAPAEPSTLTSNDRECIKYLHKLDPVLWNVEALSESFPATPNAIRKVLKAKFIASEEQRRKMDLKVQKNWELLAEGKLEADPEVLKHLKKFINRKEVLLDQIKKADFYLPEVKENITWNNGEMSNILSQYEKAIQRLVCKQQSQNPLRIGDGSQGCASMNKNKREIYIGSEISKGVLLKGEEKELQDAEVNIDESVGYASKNKKDKEIFRGSNISKKVEDEEKELQSAKVISDESLGCASKTKKKGKIYLDSGLSKKVMLKHEEKEVRDSEVNSNESVEYVNEIKVREIYVDSEMQRNLKFRDLKKACDLPDSRTKFILSNDIGKFLQEMNAKVESEDLSLPNKVSEEKANMKQTEEKIYHSDPEKLRQEAQFFAEQERDLENTAFWNKSRTSKEKAIAENGKGPLGGPDTIARGKISSGEYYPERIKIPRDKKGSGLTFRVRDCYYDDDGEFLYRVPGMVK